MSFSTTFQLGGLAGRPQKTKTGGFTLVEILIALALVTTLTLMTFQAIAPWMRMRQEIETERKLEQLQEAMTTLYREHAMQIESQSGARLDVTVGSGPYSLEPSTITGSGANRRCEEHPTAGEVLHVYTMEDSSRTFRDGSNLPLCLFITSQQQVEREGVTLYFHSVAIVALGRDGVLGEETELTPAGVLKIDAESDDMGVLVNGFTIQYNLYQETRARVERVAGLYGTYFTARYLGNPSRDYSIDYFVAGSANLNYDEGPGALPQPTAGGWLPVSVALNGMGLGPMEAVTPYEGVGNIEVANQALDSGEIVNGVQVQEPQTPGRALALPPYTALIRARLPGPATGPSGQSENYLLRVVPGNY